MNQDSSSASTAASDVTACYRYVRVVSVIPSSAAASSARRSEAPEVPEVPEVPECVVQLRCTDRQSSVEAFTKSCLTGRGPGGSPGPGGSTGPGGSPGPGGSTGPGGSPGPGGSTGPGGSPGPGGSTGPSSSPGPGGSPGPGSSTGPSSSPGPGGSPGPSGSTGPGSGNGVDLYYEQTGTGEHAVLLLPGALGSTKTDFGPQLKSLNKERFTVVGWDPRGYGQSRPPDRDFPPGFFERDAKDAVDLMKALGFGKFSLLGWSDGGITALIAAARNPDLINKMVVWGSNSFVSKDDLKLYAAVRDVSKWSARMRQPMEEVYGAQAFATLWEAWVDGFTQFAHRPEGSVCMELLPLIRCPTFIVHGEKDPMVPSFHPQYLLKHINGSRLHLMPEGKHNLHLRYADEFNQLVEDFLQE